MHDHLRTNRELTMTASLCDGNDIREVLARNLIVTTNTATAKNLYFCLCRCSETKRACFLVMVSLRETREALLLAHHIGIINDVEFLLLFDLNKSKNPDYHE